jgi:hypothetical protein
MKQTDPEFWKELTKGQSQNLPNATEILLEDSQTNDTHIEDVVADDSELPMPILIAAMTGGELPENVGVRENGGLVSFAEAEDIDIEPESEIASVDADSADSRPNLDDSEPGLNEKGRGKRRKTANKYYSSVAFWQHNDEDDWKDDSLILKTSMDT